MWLDSYQWHYDYIRLAWDTGFSFGSFNPANFDKHKLILVDVESIVKERDIASVENCIPSVIYYNLESEQAAVLDQNFVKIFRLSQLAVEYLLFCKKYLDNTVVLLKKDILKLKQEVKELKKYIEELQTQLTDFGKNNLIATFKCEKCPKLFSSEEYLNCHIQRRHSEAMKELGNSETDKLHSEIKQLKERLNGTEKLFNEKVASETEVSWKKYENDIITDMQEKFKTFKEQIENEIVNIQLEKSFYEDKYSKLYEIFMQYKNSVKENYPKDNVTIKNFAVEKTDTSTQTFNLQNEEIIQSKIQNVEIIESKGINIKMDSFLEKQEFVNLEMEQKIIAFSEMVESKISSGLNNIESQMQIFWEKLESLDTNQNKPPSVHWKNEIRNELSPATSAEFTEKPESRKLKIKPPIKPRTKFRQGNTLVTATENIIKIDTTNDGSNKPLVKLPDKLSMQIVQSLNDEVQKHFLKSKPLLKDINKDTTVTNKENKLRSSKSSTHVKLLETNIRRILESRGPAIELFSNFSIPSEEILNKAFEIFLYQENLR